MGSGQVAAIRPAIVEAIAGAPLTCVTLEMEGCARNWVQFVDGTINAAYPFETDPMERVRRLPAMRGLELDSWEPRQYATFGISEDDSTTIANWIDAYFNHVLDCPEGYDVDIEYMNLRKPTGAAKPPTRAGAVGPRPPRRPQRRR